MIRALSIALYAFAMILGITAASLLLEFLAQFQYKVKKWK